MRGGQDAVVDGVTNDLRMDQKITESNGEVAAGKRSLRHSPGMEIHRPVSGDKQPDERGTTETEAFHSN